MPSNNKTEQALIDHSRAKHNGNVSAECEECFRLVKDHIAALGLTIDYIRRLVANGVKPPASIASFVNKLLRSADDDPWS